MTLQRHRSSLLHTGTRAQTSNLLWEMKIQFDWLESVIHTPVRHKDLERRSNQLLKSARRRQNKALWKARVIKNNGTKSKTKATKESSRNGACVNARWLRVQWATVLTQILFGVNSWAISASGVMEVFALYLHSHIRPLRIVGFVTNPSCCSLESLYSVCVCVHIVQCCQVCSLYRKLVQTEIRHIPALAYRGACSTSPDLVSARNCKQKPENVCCVVFCIRLCLNMPHYFFKSLKKYGKFISQSLNC